MNGQPEAYIGNGAEEDARKDDMNGHLCSDNQLRSDQSACQPIAREVWLLGGFFVVS